MWLHARFACPIGYTRDRLSSTGADLETYIGPDRRFHGNGYDYTDVTACRNTTSITNPDSFCQRANTSTPFRRP